MAEQSNVGNKVKKNPIPSKLIKTISLLNWEPKFEDVIDGLTATPYTDASSQRGNNPSSKHAR